ncbi:MAG: helix-turn-helix domain-containing protein [Pirellulales bacterium]
MAKKRIKLSDQLRRAIQESPKTRYRIWQETGLAESTLSKFMSGKGGLSVEGLDKIADCLGLNLTTEQVPKTKKGR